MFLLKLAIILERVVADVEEEDYKAGGYEKLADIMIEYGLDKLFITPTIEPETVIGKVIMTKFSLMRCFVFYLFFLP